MVVSLDGATTVEGVSGQLGGEADREMFHALRAIPDVILAAAGTVRAERYGPPVLPADRQAVRRARGQRPLPRLAVVSASGNLDPEARLFRDATSENRPVVFTTAAGAAHGTLDDVAEVVVEGSGTDRVDLRGALAWLGAQGHSVVLCEGGANLNGQLVADDLIDEWRVTVAPEVVGGSSGRMVEGPEMGGTRPLHLAGVLEQDGVLLLRYLHA